MYPQLKINNDKVCPSVNSIDLTWKTTCTWRQVQGRREIVFLSTYGQNKATCTNILNLDTREWKEVNGELQPPFGGYLIQ